MKNRVKRSLHAQVLSPRSVSVGVGKRKQKNLHLSVFCNAKILLFFVLTANWFNAEIL